MEGWQPIDNNKYYLGTSSAYTMKGKEGFDALLNMDGEEIVTDWSMTDCFIELLKDNPNELNEAQLTQQNWWHKGC